MEFKKQGNPLEKVIRQKEISTVIGFNIIMSDLQRKPLFLLRCSLTFFDYGVK